MSLADLLHPPIKWEFRSNNGIGDVGPQQIGSLLTIDVTIDESAEFESQVTMHPVEAGIDVVDHKRPRPTRLSMRGIITDAANNALESLAGIPTAIENAIRVPGSVGFDDIAGRHSQEGYIKLRVLAARTDPLTVVTQREVFENMIITSLRFQKSDAGFYIGFSMELVELQVAVTDFVAALNTDQKVKHSASTKQNQLIPPGDESEDRSWLRALSDWSAK